MHGVSVMTDPVLFGPAVGGDYKAVLQKIIISSVLNTEFQRKAFNVACVNIKISSRFNLMHLIVATVFQENQRSGNDQGNNQYEYSYAYFHPVLLVHDLEAEICYVPSLTGVLNAALSRCSISRGVSSSSILIGSS